MRVYSFIHAFNAFIEHLLHARPEIQRLEKAGINPVLMEIKVWSRTRHQSNNHQRAIKSQFVSADNADAEARRKLKSPGQ